MDVSEEGPVVEVTTDSVPEVPTDDVNTEDLSAFEQGMKNLDVSGTNVLTKGDSGKLSVTPTAQEPNIDKKSDMEQLFETCSMIQTKQRSNFPVKPPVSCLMDAQTVSDLVK